MKLDTTGFGFLLLCFGTTYLFRTMRVYPLLLCWRITLSSGRSLRMSPEATAEAFDPCPLQLCWDVYQSGQESLDFYDDVPAFPLTADHHQSHLSSSSSHVSMATDDVWHQRCSVFRSFFSCIRNHSRSCLGNLNFHSAHKSIERQMKRLNCSSHGPIYRPGVSLNPGPPYQTPCSFHGKSEMVYCSVFGDPHIRTFDGRFETCKVRGAWPLIDNDQFTVQTTNEPQQNNEEDFTSISKVTVIAKADHECAGDRYASYHAQGGYLPSTFDNGRTELGAAAGVYIRQFTAEHVEISFRRIAATIVLRVFGPMYSVVIAMPMEVARRRDARREAPIQLCMTQCPSDERFSQEDMEQVLRRRGASVAQRSEARSRCRAEGLTDSYLDSCIFDVVVAGDFSLSNSSVFSYEDGRRLIQNLGVKRVSGGGIELAAAAEGVRDTYARASRKVSNGTAAVWIIALVCSVSSAF